MDIIITVLVTLSLVIFTFCLFYWKKKKELFLFRDLDKENKALELKNSFLEKDIEKAEGKILSANSNYEKILADLDNLQSRQKKKMAEDLGEYSDYLDKKYQEKESEYKNLTALLEDTYTNRQLELATEYDTCLFELNKIKATRSAAIEAARREQLIKEEKENFCIKISPTDLRDISILESIKAQLSQPRILSMLIWQTYYKTPMAALCNLLTGSSVKQGIYKITNQLNGLCYIGQAKNISDRFKEHAKCGLGIDTPQGNKLYKAMIEDGLYNFSFEIIEECSQELLDEKESFYIDLYDSKNFGYNSQNGNNSKRKEK